MKRALGELLDVVVATLGVLCIVGGIANAIVGNWSWAALEVGAGGVAVALVAETRREER